MNIFLSPKSPDKANLDISYFWSDLDIVIDTINPLWPVNLVSLEFCRINSIDEALDWQVEFGNRTLVVELNLKNDVSRPLACSLYQETSMSVGKGCWNHWRKWVTGIQNFS